MHNTESLLKKNGMHKLFLDFEIQRDHLICQMTRSSDSQNKIWPKVDFTVMVDQSENKILKRELTTENLLEN